MRQIKKRQPPNSFNTYVQEHNASYEEIDTEVKDELRKSLILEQKGICAYCQQVLKKGIKIEHHCERSICNGQNDTRDRRLDYNNLFAVCKGFGGMKKTQHCDTNKANFNQTNGLPITVNPLNPDHIRTINYSSTGLLRSNNGHYNKEINDILALNIEYIKDLRKRKWMQLFSNSKNKLGSINIRKLKKLIECDLALKNNSFQNSFPGLSEYMLNKFCK